MTRCSSFTSQHSSKNEAAALCSEPQWHYARLCPSSEYVTCVHVIVVFLQCKLFKLFEVLSKLEKLFLTPLIAFSECKSKAIKVMFELGYKISVAWIASQECISPYF